MKNTRTVIFPCECGDPLHELRVKVWRLEDTVKCDLVIMPGGKLGMKDRIKTAWKILSRGTIKSETIYLDQVEAERLENFIKEAKNDYALRH